MVRLIRAELPEGWGRVPAGDDAEPDYLNASAFARWGAPMKWAGVADEVIAAVGDQLNALAPRGWKPTGSGDEIVAKVIDSCWRD